MASRKVECDVVFVGGGSAGLCGAVRARELGLRTVVLEKLGSCGGDAMISAGFWLASETKLQEEKGIKDSKEDLYRYLMQYSSYRCRPELIRVLVDRAASNIEWLEKQGLAQTKDIHTHGVTSVPRVHQNEGMGAQYVNVIKERAEAMGAEFIMKAGAKSLILEGERVVGVKAETDAGDSVEVRAKGVVLATGGFGKNKQMVEDHVPIRKHVMVCAGWARGDGVRLAKEVGAAVNDLNCCIGYKAEMPDTAGLSMRSFYLILFSNYAVVNRNGLRFMDESLWNAYFAHALYNQPDARGFVIIDEAMRTGNPFTDLAKEVESGRVKKADDFSSLAREIGVPEEPFSAQLNRYNSYAQSGVDEEFGKAAELLTPLSQPPFYAIEIIPLVLNTMGGVVIDKDARALKPDGNPIPGLFAAGNTTAGFFDSYPSTGMGLQVSSIFAQVAAESVNAGI